MLPIHSIILYFLKKFFIPYFKYLIYIFGIVWVGFEQLHKLTTPFTIFDIHLLTSLAIFVVVIHAIGNVIEGRNLMKKLHEIIPVIKDFFPGLLIVFLILLLGHTFSGVITSRHGFKGTAYAGETKMRSTQIAFLIGFVVELLSVTIHEFGKENSKSKVGIKDLLVLAMICIIGLLTYFSSSLITNVYDLPSSEVQRAVINTVVVLLAVVGTEIAIKVDKVIWKYRRIAIIIAFVLTSLMIILSAHNTTVY